MLSFVQTLSDREMEQVCALYCDAFNAPDKGEDWTVEGAADYFRDDTNEDSIYALKFDEDGSLQAFVFGGRHDGGEFYLSQFVVSEGVRGCGVGRYVLRGYVSHVSRLDYSAIIVRCREDNDVMTGLLSSEGFRVFKRYEDTFGGVTCTRLMFQKEL